MTESRLCFCVLVLLDLSIGGCSYAQNALPDIGNTEFIKECVRVHNYFRSNVKPPASNMKRMSWDHALAKTANAWAKKCKFEHNSEIKIPGRVHPNFTTVGENIWTGSLSLFNVNSAIKDWYNEVWDYTYTTQHCSSVCGHYTQVVWATSYKVGCAVQFCQNVQGFHLPNAAHFICNYGPSGNYPTRPYMTGEACSKCHGEPCIDKLCGKLEEEASEKAASCDQYCITILVLRPSLAILTLGAVFVVQRHYPTMNIQE